MAPQVKCECDYVIRADTDDDVLATVRKISDDQILDWIEIVA